MIYSLEFINNLISLNKSNYTLPEKIIVTLNNLEKELNSCKTFNNKNTKYINNNNNNNDWKRREKIKITKIYKPDNNDISEKLLYDFKGILNKLTNKNYDILSLEISELLKDYDITDDIINIVFNTASLNSYHSETYAKLCYDNKKIYVKIREIIKNNVELYIESYNNIKNITPEENYDEYCKNRLNNSSRLARTIFYYKLSIHNIIDNELILFIFNKLSTRLLSQTKIKEQLNTNIEIIENIFILLTNCQNIFDKDKINELLPICDMNPKIYIGINNKLLFKLMDINDIINNK